MSILLQAIEEYLREEHPEWKAGTTLLGSICIERILPQPKYIYINTCINTILFMPSSINISSCELEDYTDHTLLSQISKYIRSAAE